MTDYSKLTNSEIDRMVAERIMGWVTLIPANSNVLLCWKDGDPEVDDANLVNAWHPATNHTDAALMLAEIERKGLTVEYLEALSFILHGPISSEEDHGPTLWQIVTATPRRKCEAALKVVEESHA